MRTIGGRTEIHPSNFPSRPEEPTISGSPLFSPDGRIKIGRLGIALWAGLVGLAVLCLFPWLFSTASRRYRHCRCSWPGRSGLRASTSVFDSLLTGGRGNGDPKVSARERRKTLRAAENCPETLLS